jgi:hypothetical protein
VGVVDSGPRSYLFDGRALKNGIYMYRLRVDDPVAARTQATLSGKLLLTR